MDIKADYTKIQNFSSAKYSQNAGSCNFSGRFPVRGKNAITNAIKRESSSLPVSMAPFFNNIIAFLEGHTDSSSAAKAFIEVLPSFYRRVNRAKDSVFFRLNYPEEIKVITQTAVAFRDFQSGICTQPELKQRIFKQVSEYVKQPQNHKIKFVY